MAAADVAALLLTLKLACVSTVILVVIAIPLSYWLHQLHGREDRQPRSRLGYSILRTVITMPLVLPPTVLGFYLILLLAPDSWLVRQLGLPALLFSFPGLVIGSVIYSLPLTVAPIADGFLAIPSRYLTAADNLGLSRLSQLIRIILPLARKGVLTGAVLGFAHTLGEFGVVLMIGGNIPGRTRLLSMAIYDHVEALDFAAAHRLAAIALGLSFILLVIIQLLGRRAPAR